MNILLASTSSGSRGGGELYLVYLARALAARGHNITLWASSHPRMDELCAHFGGIGSVMRQDYTNTYDRRFRSISSHLDLRSARAVAGSWKTFAPDIVHVNKQNLEDGLDLLRAAEASGLPGVCTIHLTQSARHLRAIAAWMRDWVSRQALDRYRGPLVTVIEQRRRDLCEFLGEQGRIRAIPNGVELFDLTQRHAIREARRAQLDVAHESLLVVAVGRMVPQKRPLLFLELAERIHKRLPQSRFIWVGDGALAPDWDRLVAERHLAGIVQRIPWQKNVRDILFAADAFLHVAEFEGLPLAILEAFSAGLPCAITPNLLREMPFLDEESTMAVTDDGPWTDILSDPGRLAILGRNARRLAEEQFSFDMMAERYESLYRETLAQKS